MARSGWILTLAGALGFVAGCASSAPPATFGVEPIMTLMSKSAQLSVAVRTAPQPPTRGDQSAEYAITDAATGAPVSGLTLSVVPWMPAMLHGTSVVPTVRETKPGLYVISDVDLFMAGLWELRTTITGSSGDAGADAGAISDYVAPQFEIP
jgi:hypothetical protein